MKTYKLNLYVEYEVEAEDEEDAYDKLKDYLAKNNMTAENEFWDNMKIEEVKDCVHSWIDVDNDGLEVCRYCSIEKDGV